MERKLGLLAAVVVAVGCGGTGENRTDASPSPATGTTMGGAYASPATGITGATSGEFAAEVVAVDTAARTVTLRDSAVGGTAATGTTGTTGTTGSTAAGGTTTVRVEGMAGDNLRDFKTGDKVVVSCSMGGGGTMGTGGTAGTTGGTTGTTGTTAGSTAGTTGTTGAGGMGGTGTGATGTAGGTGTSTGGYGTTGGTMGSSTAVLSGCTSVTAIRKAT